MGQMKSHSIKQFSRIIPSAPFPGNSGASRRQQGLCLPEVLLPHVLHLTQLCRRNNLGGRGQPAGIRSFHSYPKLQKWPVCISNALPMAQGSRGNASLSKAISRQSRRKSSCWGNNVLLQKRKSLKKALCGWPINFNEGNKKSDIFNPPVICKCWLISNAQYH